MNIISCLHPRSIMRYGEHYTVPCGKCEVCRNIRNMAISERLRLESQSHKYCVFFTLKYSDPFLPRLLNDGNTFFVPDSDCLDILVSQDAGLSWDYNMSQKDLAFCDNLIRVRGFIPRLRKYDVQNFVKRLRINIKRKCFKNENYKKSQYISYAICGEYGPSSFRPHYHGLLFFDNFKIAEQFKNLLRASWSYGSSSFRYTSDANSARYVAKYVNSVYCLPNFYQHSEIRPFLLLSKTCPVGFGALSEKEVQRSFRDCSATVSVYDAAKGSYTDIPLWRSLENKLYPKFTGFDRLYNWQRVEVFRFVDSSRSPKDLKLNVLNLLESHNSDSFCHDNKKNAFIYEYFWTVLKSQYLNDDLSDIDIYSKIFNYANYFKVYNQLSGIYYTVKRLADRLFSTGLTLEEYFFKIDKYTSNRKLYLLKNQFEFENTFMFHHPEYLKYLVGSYYDDDLFELPIVKQYLDDLHHSIVHSSKNRVKREWLSKHPEYKIFHGIDDCDHDFV